MRYLFALLIALGWLVSPAAAQDCRLPDPGTTGRVAIGQTGRSAWIHRPANHERGRLPVLFALHGSGGSGTAILKESGLEDTSDRHGFLLIAPDGGITAGQGFVWNIPGVPTVTGAMPTAQDADDVAFIGAAIDWLAARGCIDRQRVYATGFSGGGRMTSWLGCVASDRIAAIAPVVGLRAGNPRSDGSGFPDPATCAPERPVPVIAFAGDADTVNPVAGGGAGYWQYGMARAMARWADINGCRTMLAAREAAPGVVEQGYGDCRDGARVIGRVTRGAGHVWTPDNDALWAFLSRHRRR
ncbi:polyhydroxybutyrate depolymerase [Sphingomonas sp. BGYR3]|uniref:alpha/beta hydrolase family esterase n=1 Tax=Sphingomonas sp. BGYR3 TaxID=2975483 RepID=UPI0021A729F5|nr:polyhydroxybutyrate depolymerase [Sphingomonas sp. BGYR3]MDG5488558.1 polyhydroxybutyrate depolymerase [Sphingomonas sp. BGYR3]